jgi:hypothetical protein
VTGACDNGGMRTLLVVALLLVAATGHAEEHQPKQLNTAEIQRLDVARAFRNCSLVQKTDPSTLTEYGKTATADCMRLAIAYRGGDWFDTDGPRIKVNAKLALQYFFVGCRYGVAEGCVEAGRMLEEGQAAPAKGKDPVVTAIIAYTAGCETLIDEKRLGSEAKTVALSCTSAGLLLVNNALKKKRPGVQLKSGLKMIERACQMGDDLSCRTLAKMEQAVAGAGQ